MSLLPNDLPHSSNLPQRQQALLRIKELIVSGRLSREGYLPSIRKTAELVGLNRDAVWHAYGDLEAEGYIRSTPNKRYEIAPSVRTTHLRTLDIALITVGDGAIRFAGLQRFRNVLAKNEKLFGIKINLHCAIDAGNINPDWLKNADGIIFGGFFEHPEALQALPKTAPRIGIITTPQSNPDIDIQTDNHLGGRIAAKRLIESGARRPCVIAFDRAETQKQTALRLLGFQTGWVENGGGLDDITVKWINDHNEYATLKRVDEIAGETAECDGYFTLSKEAAINLLGNFEHHGRRVPEEAKVISFDGTFDGLKTNPPLTYIKQNFEKMASISIEKLRALIANDETNPTPEAIVVPPELVARQSS